MKPSILHLHPQLFCLFLRCHLVNGKTLWLCSTHQKQDRISILSNDVADVAFNKSRDTDAFTAAQLYKNVENTNAVTEVNAAEKNAMNSMVQSSSRPASGSNGSRQPSANVKSESRVDAIEKSRKSSAQQSSRPSSGNNGLTCNSQNGDNTKIVSSKPSAQQSSRPSSGNNGYQTSGSK